jgi:hypothetical protein
VQKLKILLDEHLDLRLRLLFDSRFEVFTIKDKKWQGMLNGDLLQLIVKDGIEVFITNDKNLRYQQKLNKNDLIIIELNTKGNQYFKTDTAINEINIFLLSNKFRQQLKKRKKTFYIVWGENESY